MTHRVSTSSSPCPKEVDEYARRAVDYVAEALALTLEYDSDTLPILDHYLRSVPPDQPDLVALVAVTSGAYFGEVVRRRLGGTWDLSTGEPDSWRIVLPTGLSFAPAGVVAEAIGRDEAIIPANFDAPPRLRPHLESTLERMGEVTLETFYSLCGRLDTLEHVQDVLLAIAAKLAKEHD